MINIPNGFLNKLHEGLKQSGLSDQEVTVFTNEFTQEVKNQQPPKIALIGVTGVGKTSTINALFNTGLEISHFRSCTQKEAIVPEVASQFAANRGTITVYDMPGLGESLIADKSHIETYKRVLPEVDVAVWIIEAGGRALSLMQQSLKTISAAMKDKKLERIMFAINKADLMYPNNWNRHTNTPSREQWDNLVQFAKTVERSIKEVVNRWNGEIKIYSALKKYRLEPLLTSMIETAPKQRRWILDEIADVADPLADLDPRVSQIAQQMFVEQYNPPAALGRTDKWK